MQERDLCLKHLATLLEHVIYHNFCHFADLIDLVVQHLTEGSCQGFRRPTAPSDSLLGDIIAMTAFTKAALDGNIEHDALTTLYQVAFCNYCLHAFRRCTALARRAAFSLSVSQDHQ